MNPATGRATIESSLMLTCAVETLEDAHWETATWLLQRRGRDDQNRLLMVPMWVWRAFYKRHPERMRQDIRCAVRDAVPQIEADITSDAVRRAMDAIWSI